MAEIRPHSPPESVLPLWSRSTPRADPGVGTLNEINPPKSSSHDPATRSEAVHRRSPAKPHIEKNPRPYPSTDSDHRVLGLKPGEPVPLHAPNSPTLSRKTKSLPRRAKNFLGAFRTNCANIIRLLRSGVSDFYHSRLLQIFESANMTPSDVEKFVVAMRTQSTISDADLPLKYRQIVMGWRELLDDARRELNACNIVSALLIPSVMGFLQIGNSSENIFIVSLSTVALLLAVSSLLCGLMCFRYSSIMDQRLVLAEFTWAYTHEEPTLKSFSSTLAQPGTFLIGSIAFLSLCPLLLFGSIVLGFEEFAVTSRIAGIVLIVCAIFLKLVLLFVVVGAVAALQSVYHNAMRKGRRISLNSNIDVEPQPRVDENTGSYIDFNESPRKARLSSTSTPQTSQSDLPEGDGSHVGIVVEIKQQEAGNSASAPFADPRSDLLPITLALVADSYLAPGLYDPEDSEGSTTLEELEVI